MLKKPLVFIVCVWKTRATYFTVELTDKGFSEIRAIPVQRCRLVSLSVN